MQMNRSYIAALVLAALVAGCATSNKLYSDTSTQSAYSPTHAPTPVAIVPLPASVITIGWPEDAFNKGRWTAHGDNDGMSCWCNSRGDWGITGKISNHSIWRHHYRIGVEFGHTYNNDPDTFVSYSFQTTKTIKLRGRHDQKTAIGSGANVDAIRNNFHIINSARPVLYEF
jgi:hypothetical protein